ncbi:ABC transporter ATP-binding protein [Pseudonocardia acaciae]|uniref:ABC transporter ATP-binding protein n=1 Tax=Pseudonocardia acaciae TaxID=551276 RepID=UPI0004907743|nr:ABC transporter ATP-binding protein [Pseudonocardia acaciae]
MSERGLLHLREVAKVYSTRSGEATTALRDVSLSLRAGEFVSLIGPSGCGKSTLLKIVAGLIDVTHGELVADGAELAPRNLGVVFQSPVMLPWRTVLRNVLLSADVLGLDRAEATERARRLLAAVGLDAVEQMYPTELSGGMQQRVAIARALLHDPAILLMDEPFGALDAITREDLNTRLQGLHTEQAKTVLFVTHNIDEAVFLSDRIVVMSGRPGRVVAEVPVDLPRPRSVRDKLSAEFRTIESLVRDKLEEGGHEPGAGVEPQAQASGQ